MSGGQCGALLDGVLEAREGVIKLLLLESLDILENQHFGLRETGAELVESVHLVEFLFSGAGLALGTQGNAEIVMGLLEIGFELDGATEGSDSAGDVGAGFELHTEI